MQLAAGDTLDFAVGPYLYGHGWDSTGLTLSLIPVPEPSIVALLILGLAWWRRRCARRVE